VRIHDPVALPRDDELFTLQIAMTRERCSRACRTAIRVSIVSPDWEIAMTRVDRVRIGFAVAELAGQLHLAGNLAPVLDGVLRDHPAW